MGIELDVSPSITLAFEERKTTCVQYQVRTAVLIFKLKTKLSGFNGPKEFFVTQELYTILMEILINVLRYLFYYKYIYLYFSRFIIVFYLDSESEYYRVFSLFFSCFLCVVCDISLQYSVNVSAISFGWVISLPPLSNFHLFPFIF